jgi:hypothetical protein
MTVANSTHQHLKSPSDYTILRSYQYTCIVRKNTAKSFPIPIGESKHRKNTKKHSVVLNIIAFDHILEPSFTLK